MALTDENGSGMVMPVAPMYGSGNGNSGFGWGGDWAWIILLLVLCGGWGNGFGGGFGGGGEIYPWMNQANLTSNGFQNALMNDNVTSIRDGINGISTQLCNGFADTSAAIAGAQNALAQQMYSNQITDLQQSFALQSQLAQCCCDNRAATQDLKYTLANEACATRQNSTANTQAILDKLCQLELDGYKRENDNLRNQLNMASLRESQTAQNAFIAQGLNNEVDALYNRLNNCPVPTTPVYGRTPIFTCGGNGCGCGCGG